jgi:hypothetical protein
MTKFKLAVACLVALTASWPALAGMAPPEKPEKKDEPRQLQTLRDVGPAIARCWLPPAVDGPGEITVTLSFNRTGAIIGVPHISYSRALDPEQKQRLKASVLYALAHCGPLPFSPSLGAAIAGQVFAIRFLITAQKGQDI